MHGDVVEVAKRILSTQAIIETLRSHRKDLGQASMFDLFGDPQRPLADAITKTRANATKLRLHVTTSK
jgi:hypothetical protein